MNWTNSQETAWPMFSQGFDLVSKLQNAQDHFLFKVFWPKRHLPRWSPVALLAAAEEALHLWRLQHCCHVIRVSFFLSNNFLLQAKQHNLWEGGKTVRTKGKWVLNRACSSPGDNDNDNHAKCSFIKGGRVLNWEQLLWQWGGGRGTGCASSIILSSAACACWSRYSGGRSNKHKT